MANNYNTQLQEHNADILALIEQANNLPDNNPQGEADLNAFINWLTSPTTATLVIPEGTQKIGDAAFRNIYSMIAVELPESLTSIGAQAFRGCTNLAGTVDLKNVVTVYSTAFRDSAKIAALNLGTKLEDIRDTAFRGLTAITSIEFPGTLNRIQSSAFYGCTALKTVTFVKGNRNYPTSGLAADIFSGCTALTDIYVYWAQGQVANAPWGAPSGCKIHYTDGIVTV